VHGVAAAGVRAEPIVGRTRRGAGSPRPWSPARTGDSNSVWPTAHDLRTVAVGLGPGSHLSGGHGSWPLQVLPFGSALRSVGSAEPAGVDRPGIDRMGLSSGEPTGEVSPAAPEIDLPSATRPDLGVSTGCTATGAPPGGVRTCRRFPVGAPLRCCRRGSGGGRAAGVAPGVDPVVAQVFTSDGCPRGTSTRQRCVGVSVRAACTAYATATGGCDVGNLGWVAAVGPTTGPGALPRRPGGGGWIKFLRGGVGRLPRGPACGQVLSAGAVTSS